MKVLVLPLMLLSMTAFAQLNPTTTRVHFLSLHFTESNGKITPELTENKSVTGVFKIGPVEKSDRRPGSLVVQVQTTATAAVELEVPLANPLLQDVEYSPSEGTLARQVVHRAVGDSTVRLPLALEGKTVLIQQFLPDGSRVTLKVLRF